MDTSRQSTPNTSKPISKLPTAAGARAALFTRGLDRPYLAIHDRGTQETEIRVFRPRQLTPRRSPPPRRQTPDAFARDCPAPGGNGHNHTVCG